MTRAGPSGRPKPPPFHHWFNEATAVWSENEFSDDPAFESLARNGNKFAPFVGLELGAASSVDEAGKHGYGMSALVQYLVIEHGTIILGDIYDRIAEGLGAASSIELEAGDFGIWWSDFLAMYAGGILNPIDRALLLNERSGSFNIYNPDDIAYTHTMPYPDLSGRIYRILLDDFELPESTTLSLTASGSFSDIHVFRYSRQGVFLVDSGSGNITIPGIRALMDDDLDLLVLVSQTRGIPDYLSSQDITFSATVDRDVLDMSVFNRIRTWWCLHMDVLYDDGGTEYGGVCLPQGIGGTELIIDGTSFSSAIDLNFQQTNYVSHFFGSVTGTFSADFSQILQITSELNNEKIYPDQTVEIEFFR